MFVCPGCGQKLTRQQTPIGVYWACQNCGGRAASIPLLRKTARRDCVNAIWGAARDGHKVTDRLCPACDHNMVEVQAGIDGHTLVLDVCKRCEFVWFDSNEYEVIPPAPPQPRPLGEIDEKKLPQAAREALAIYKVQQMAERERAEDPSPDEGWKTVPALLGLPVEIDADPLQHWPWATWGLSLAIALFSVLAFTNLENAVAQYGLVPGQVWRDGGSTMLTSFFLHAGVIHLLGNLYFLVLFGNHVEDYLGKTRFLLLILVSTVTGDLLHVMAQPNSTVPCIGASGGISGVIAFYALEFPRARLGFLLRYWWRFQRFQLPAWGAFVLWILLQCWGAVREVSGFSAVASLAHIGGAIAGVALWFAWRARQARTLPTGPTPGVQPVQ